MMPPEFENTTTDAIPGPAGERSGGHVDERVERPYVGLVFYVPGLTETLRVNG